MFDFILGVFERVNVAFVGSNQKQVFVGNGKVIDKLLLLQMGCYLDADDSFDSLLP